MIPLYQLFNGDSKWVDKDVLVPYLKENGWGGIAKEIIEDAIETQKRNGYLQTRRGLFGEKVRMTQAGRDYVDNRMMVQNGRWKQQEKT
jgi:hypothetical protein